MANDKSKHPGKPELGTAATQITEPIEEEQGDEEKPEEQAISDQQTFLFEKSPFPQDAAAAKAAEGDGPEIESRPTLMREPIAAEAVDPNATMIRDPISEQAAPVDPGATMIRDPISPPDAKPSSTVITEPVPEEAAEAAGATIRKDLPATKAEEAQTPDKDAKGKDKKKGKKDGAAEGAKPGAGPGLLLLAGFAVVAVVLGVAALQSGKPSAFDLQWMYTMGFRIPEEATPPPDQVAFEFVSKEACAHHPEDTCHVYRMTGPRLSSKMTIYKAKDGWKRDDLGANAEFGTAAH